MGDAVDPRSFTKGRTSPQDVHEGGRSVNKWTTCPREADFSSERPPASVELYAFVQPTRTGGLPGEKAASRRTGLFRRSRAAGLLGCFRAA